MKKDAKVQITFRLKPDTIDRLKSINKYHSKMDKFLNYAMDDYFEWLDARHEKRRATLKRNQELQKENKNI
ncbi:hypothetical protein [Clostridium sporogenes]|uniref:hypothetical protein n=1 Tax=Clostridium sporogenes TaxID=1509 RepID=UPI0007179C69|nr:hypothetical protein [Clostridium sporogenes]KRU40048.1 hypothetical protein VT94_25250 [Clostridium sporogenes]MBY7065137.1 hypothetical protein [Clostridium sporogenes]MBY7071817.1 hypothetical protein [Clostridium sporogenes]MCW6065875.1 hypothetical protein [Clostridium sporogenes]OQP88554.1 hypothetical protein VT93_0201980 [Clostridium sporogenes]